jgi:hypothetical protein
VTDLAAQLGAVRGELVAYRLHVTSDHAHSKAYRLEVDVHACQDT